MGGVLALLGRDEAQTAEWDAARQHLKEQRRARSADFREHRRRSNERLYARLSQVRPRVDNVL